MRCDLRARLLRAGLCVLGLLLASSLAQAQEPAGDGGLVDADSSVGYIDSALPRNTLRLRYDAAWDNNRPTRAEFFYAKGGVPFSPGPPLPETRVDYQEFTSYLEWALNPCFSVFAEGGFRALDPTFNANDAGIGDTNLGFKWAFVNQEGTLATFQMRTYIPTGIRHEGLGTGHVSLEPALLFNQRLAEYLTLEAECRYWVPLGGTDFAGDVVRYGVGLSYGGRNEQECWWVNPVAELVGWTVLGGKELVVRPPLAPVVKGAAGDTIVNAKLGLRLGYEDLGDLYVGYGRALTGDVWYRDVVRVELRWFF
jgi:hypothetical protein